MDRVKGRKKGKRGKGMEKGGVSLEIEGSEKGKKQERGANKRDTRGKAIG